MKKSVRYVFKIYINSLYLAARKTMGFRFTASFQTFPLRSPAPILNLRLSVSSYLSSCCCEGSQAVLLFTMVGRVNINLALWCGEYSWTLLIHHCGVLLKTLLATVFVVMRIRLNGLWDYRFSVFINFLADTFFICRGQCFEQTRATRASTSSVCAAVVPPAPKLQTECNAYRKVADPS